MSRDPSSIPSPPRSASQSGRRADPFASLNDEQRAAAAHGLGEAAPAPLLVIAGAGTGKTMTLAARVAQLVLAGADPNRLLLLTFSRRAALGMAQRSGALLQAALGRPSTLPAPALPWCGTFHAIGARLLREQAPRIGLPEDFTILDRADAEELMGLVREQLGHAAARRRFPLKGTCLAIASRVVNSGATVEQVVGRHFPWCLGWEAELRALLRAYVHEKQQQHCLDYDDLLLYWHAMLGDTALAAALGARWDHVLVDEFQDTNRLQAEILHALKPDGRGLTVVGDDAQSIYGFRAAEVRNILDFPSRYEPPARVVTLTRNYRSTQPILDLANTVIAGALEGHRKSLRSERPGPRPQLVTVEDDAAQARWVADAVLAEREAGVALKRQAVLFRTGHHSAALELELARRDIPFVKFGGLKFLEAAHVKDLLSVLRWVQNPRSRLAGFRIAQRVPGIGPAHARRLVDLMGAADEPTVALRAWTPPATAAADWRAWLDCRAALAAAPWPEAVSIAAAWLRPHLERLHEDVAVRLLDLEQLARLAGQFTSREHFLAELTLDPPEATSDEAGAPYRDEDYLILSTLHSAKGQEWSAVYLLHAVDGCIPSDMATGSDTELDEERRLLYVGLTRARQRLAVLTPLRYYVTQQGGGGPRHLYAAPSRFLDAAAMALCDRSAPQSDPATPIAPSAAPSGGTSLHTAESSVPDLLSRVRDRF